jgi:hypothetical protein
MRPDGHEPVVGAEGHAPLFRAASRRGYPVSAFLDSRSVIVLLILAVAAGSDPSTDVPTSPASQKSGSTP